MKQNKIPRNEYIRKPVGKTNPYKHDVDYVSTMGYRDDSPFNDRPYIDIHTPSGMIDMSNTGIPLMANGMYLPPYSGMYNMGTPYVREQKIPMAQDGQEFSDYQRPGPIASENPNDYLGWVGKNAEEESFPIRKNNKQVPRFLNVSNNQEPIYDLPAATTYASGKEQNYMSPERRAYEQALANAQAKQQAENIKSAVDIAGLGFYPAAVAGSIMDVAEGDYSGAAMGLIPWLGKAGKHGKFWGQAYTKAINSGIPHKAAYPAKRFLKGLTAGTGSGLQAIDVYQDNPYNVFNKAYGGDPSLANIEGHYQDGGAQTPEEWEKEIRAVENKIGDPSTWTLDSYKTLQDKLNEYKAWRENTPEGKAVIDYHNEPNEYIIPLPSHLQTVPKKPFGGIHTKTHTHMKEGGWLDAYDDEYRRGGQRRRRGTSKNIESSINDIFRRNYDVFGPAGKLRFSPRARYEEGGWLDKYQDAGQLRAASTTAAVPVSTQAPINPVNPESTMGIVDFVKHRWNTRDQGPSDWNLLMMDKTGSYVDSGVTPFDLMLAAPQQVIKTATKAAKNLPIEKAAKKVLGDRAVNQIKTDVKTVSDNVKESIKQYKKIKQYNKTYSQELKDLPDLYKQALQDLNTPEGVRRLKELGVDNMDDFMKFAESASKKGTPLATTGYGPSFDNAGKKITEPFVNINFEQIDELRKKIPLLKTKSAIDHEYGHLITDYLRSKGKTYKGVTDLDIEAVEKLTPHVTSNITDMLKKVQFKTPKKSVIKNITTPSDTELPYYFFKGSKGEEPLAHLRETKRNMLDAGIIDNIHQTITPELLKMFRAATGRKDRMLSFLQNTPEAYKTLASLLNKTPALIPIGLGVGAAANQKKMGGWLDKYNNF